jgi:DegV family protein with EDD domain
MSKVGIITDSIHGLTPELIKKNNIQVAPMGLVINNKGYRDNVDISSVECYKLLKEIRSPGTNNAALPADFVKIFEILSRKTDSILYIGVSKVLSSTFNVAQLAWNIFQESHPGIRFERIDSKNCIGALGFLLLEAASASESGKDLNEVMAVVEDLIPRVKYISALDTLGYLVRIGRMPENSVTAQTYNIRPIIGMTDNSGKIQNITAAPKPLVLDKLIELIEKNIEPGKPVHAMVHYSEYLQEAEELKKMIISKFNPVELYMSEYSPAALCASGLMTGVSIYS